MTNKEKITDELLVKTISNWFQEPAPTLNERLNEMPEGVFNYISLPNPSGWGMRIEGKMPNKYRPQAQGQLDVHDRQG